MATCSCCCGGGGGGPVSGRYFRSIGVVGWPRYEKIRKSINLATPMMFQFLVTSIFTLKSSFSSSKLIRSKIKKIKLLHKQKIQKINKIHNGV